MGLTRPTCGRRRPKLTGWARRYAASKFPAPTAVRTLDQGNALGLQRKPPSSALEGCSNASCNRGWMGRPFRTRCNLDDVSPGCCPGLKLDRPLGLGLESKSPVVAPMARLCAAHGPVPVD